MPARISIDREAILEAALDLIREGGWAAVSARSLASRLGASTMPIYSAIGSMEELKRIAAERCAALLDASQHKPRTGDPASDLGIGYLAFAREEPRLYRFIISAQGEPGGAAATLRAFDMAAAGGPESDPALAPALEGIPNKGARRDMILRSWIFSHGLADLLAGGSVSMDDEEIARHLLEVGGALYIAAQGKEE
jgi:AcrR family transcriptional regulator